MRKRRASPVVLTVIVLPVDVQGVAVLAEFHRAVLALRESNRA